MKHLALGLFLLAITSCTSNLKEVVLPFEDLPSFASEIESLSELNPIVSKNLKSLLASGESEGTVDWTTELALFVSADINKPKYKEQYKRTTTDSSGYTLITYTAQKEALKTKTVEVLTKGTKTISTTYYVDETNSIYKSKLRLVYAPGKYYTVESVDDVLGTYGNAVSITGHFSQLPKLRVKLHLTETFLPFNCTFDTNKIAPEMVVFNADERITSAKCEFSNDSFRIQMPIFNTELILAENMTGRWRNYMKGSYMIPASLDTVDYRFHEEDKSTANYGGRWEVEFSPSTESASKAIGIFEQDGNNLTGTFLTETGDHRFLQGQVHGDSLYLSCFDGAHCFLYKGAMDGEEMWGEFWSGKHWNEPFRAVRNDTFELQHPDSLTYLNEGYSTFDFSFPDLDSNMVSSADSTYDDKVLLVQIMGTWCPNCMDETYWLKDVYNKYHDQGLEVVSIGFEPYRDFQKSAEGVRKLKETTGADYTFCIGGYASKKESGEALPMLNHIMSYPTLVFIGKDKSVKRIHTGFKGPGTGEYYERFKEDAAMLIEEMLDKPSI